MLPAVREAPFATSRGTRTTSTSTLACGMDGSSSRVNTNSNACALKRPRNPGHGIRAGMSAIINKLPHNPRTIEERFGVFRHGVHRCGRRLLPVRDGRHRSRDETPPRLRINSALGDVTCGSRGLAVPIRPRGMSVDDLTSILPESSRQPFRLAVSSQGRTDLRGDRLRTAMFY